MEIVTDIAQYKWKNTAITLGKFDGVHTGHQMLIQKVLEEGKNGYLPVVFTFDQLPAHFFKQQTLLQTIFTEPEKQEYLETCGIARYILFPFSAY